MIYLFVQYLILKKCLYFWIKKKLPFETRLNIKLDYLYKSLYLTKRTIYLHTMTLSKCGYLEHVYEKDNSHSFYPTKNGWLYFLELKSKLWRIIFDCVWAVILALIGFLIAA